MRLMFDELTREELRGMARDALVLLPVGATEQHGPHLPVGTDHFVVAHIARAAAEAAGQIPVLVAPTLPFGSSHHHIPFGGTLSLSTDTYYRVLSDLATSLIRSGFRRIFILNGHGGNSELIQLVARDLALTHQAHLAAAPYWTIAWESLQTLQTHPGVGLPGHAGTFETALIMAIRAELVREPRPHRDLPEDARSRASAAPYRTELHGAWQRIDGYTDSPDHADAALGQQALAMITQAVAQALTEFYHAASIDDLP